MKTKKIFDFPLFEPKKKKNNTSVCSKKKQEMFEKHIPPPPPRAKFARVAYITMHCPLSEATTASRKVTRAMLVAKQRVGLPFDLSSIYSIR